ncbi:MAG: hypothetical protein LJE91_08875 [Gammaproteobacteria bacterium]|jgi:uncharacterized low-complexity protein|nr:hypothetical protein [Gammaproteobacteria bacterium]
MSKKSAIKPLVAAVGAAMATSLVAVPTASADANPFGMTELSSGYRVAGAEGKCGGNKSTPDKSASEGKSGEGKSVKEGKCGEGKCGGEKSTKEGKCGENKSTLDKSASEGKCGGSK